MKVFLPVTTEQRFKIRPRTGETNVKVFLRNELKQTEDTKPLQTGILDYQFLELGVEHEFIAGDEYEIKVLTASDEIIWRGKALVTAQTDLQNYKLGNE